MISSNLPETCKVLRRQLDRLKGKKDLLQQSLKNTQEHIKDQEEFLEDLKQARVFAQTVSESTQKKLEFHISNLVSMALASVFSDPPEFKIRFEPGRGKLECHLLFVKNGKEYNPIDGEGGGPLDVASFALRTAIWSIKKTRNTLILDEPMKFVSRDLQSKTSEMIKMISEKLKIQIIMVSHIPEIIECADQVINVKNINGKAIIE